MTALPSSKVHAMMTDIGYEVDGEYMRGVLKVRGVRRELGCHSMQIVSAFLTAWHGTSNVTAD
jgi:hypothetical protein